MTEPWFAEVPPWFALFALLSLLSLLAGPVDRGRYRLAMMAIWITAMVAAGGLFITAGIAFFLGQPTHVVRALLILGTAFGASFGVSFPALRRAYRGAELRKTIAADL